MAYLLVAVLEPLIIREIMDRISTWKGLDVYINWRVVPSIAILRIHLAGCRQDLRAMRRETVMLVHLHVLVRPVPTGSILSSTPRLWQRGGRVNPSVADGFSVRPSGRLLPPLRGLLPLSLSLPLPGHLLPLGSVLEGVNASLEIPSTSLAVVWRPIYMAQGSACPGGVHCLLPGEGVRVVAIGITSLRRRMR